MQRLGATSSRPKAFFQPPHVSMTVTSTAVPSYANSALRNAYMNSAVAATGGGSSLASRRASMHRRGRSFDFDEVRSQTDMSGAAGANSSGVAAEGIAGGVASAATADLILPSYINQLACPGSLLSNIPQNMSKSGNMYENGDTTENSNYSTIESSFRMSSTVVAALNQGLTDKARSKNASPVTYNNLSSLPADSPPLPLPDPTSTGSNASVVKNEETRDGNLLLMFLPLLDKLECAGTTGHYVAVDVN